MYFLYFAYIRILHLSLPQQNLELENLLSTFKTEDLVKIRWCHLCVNESVLEDYVIHLHWQ